MRITTLLWIVSWCILLIIYIRLYRKLKGYEKTIDLLKEENKHLHHQLMEKFK